MQTTTISCDGCGKKMNSGFEVSNFGERPRMVNAYLERAAHFCGLPCLAAWSIKAEASAANLVQTAIGLHPHGTFTDVNVPALAVS